MTSAATQNQPLWLSIEAQIAKLGSSDFEGNATEGTVRKLADTLDGEGYNVSRHAANMLMLRRAIDERARVGRPLMNDYTTAIDALELEDLVNPDSGDHCPRPPGRRRLARVSRSRSAR